VKHTHDANDNVTSITHTRENTTLNIDGIKVGSGGSGATVVNTGSCNNRSQRTLTFSGAGTARFGNGSSCRR
jgi:LEA14-like dessication related protein